MCSFVVNTTDRSLLSLYIVLERHPNSEGRKILMAKKRIRIDEDKCIGCGLCVSACHEGVIGLVDGKARLLQEDHCDGLGNCLPVCPVQAISFHLDPLLSVVFLVSTVSVLYWA